MSSVLAELTRLAERYQNDPVRASLELLRSQLPTAVAHCLRCAAIPHHFNGALLVVMDPSLSLETVDDACAQLVARSLAVEISEGYKLHDQVRGILFSDWLQPREAGAFRTVSGRLVQYFKTLVEASDDPWAIRRHVLFHEIGRDHKAGFELFDQEFRLARRSFRPTDCAAMIALAHEYDDVLEPEFVLRLRYQEAKHAADLQRFDDAESRFLDVSRNPTAPEDLQIKALQRLGSVYREQRKLDEAVEKYKEALELARRTAGRQDDALSLYWLATARRDQGKYELAEKALNESIDLFRQSGDRLHIARSKNALGIVFLKKQEFDKARDAFSDALAVFEEGDAQSAELLHNLGSAYQVLPDFDLSRVFFERSLELKRQSGDLSGQATTLNNLAQVLEVQEHREEAITAATQAANLFESVHDYPNAAVAARNLAKLYRRARAEEKKAKKKRRLVALHPSQALRAEREAFERAISLYERAGDQDGVRKVKREMSPSERARRIPWWAWVFLITASLVILIILLAIIAFLVGL